MARLGRSVLGIAVLLALGGRAAAVVPEVKDEGKFFSAEAVKKADDIVRDIYLKTGRDLLIETFATVPADQAEKVKAMDAAEKKNFFRKWAIDRAKQAGVNGVYILICKDPTYFWAEVAPRARKAFDSQKDARLREIIIENFRQKKFDDGLLAAAKYVQEVLTGSKGPSSGGAAGVKDQAKLFSEDAVKKADEILKETQQKTGKGVVVETFATVPADQAEKVKTMNAQEKKDFFRKWAIDRAKQAGVTGVYVLICKNPTYLWTEVAPGARKVFDSQKDARLREILLDNFKQKKFDEGLLDAVKYVQDQLAGAK